MKVEKLIWWGEGLNEAVGGAKRVAMDAIEILEGKCRGGDRERCQS